MIERKEQELIEKIKEEDLVNQQIMYEEDLEKEKSL